MLKYNNSIVVYYFILFHLQIESNVKQTKTMISILQKKNLKYKKYDSKHDDDTLKR